MLTDHIFQSLVMIILICSAASSVFCSAVGVVGLSVVFVSFSVHTRNDTKHHQTHKTQNKQNEKRNKGPRSRALRPRMPSFQMGKVSNAIELQEILIVTDFVVLIGDRGPQHGVLAIFLFWVSVHGGSV